MESITKYKEKIMYYYSNGYSFQQMSALIPYSVSYLRNYCYGLIRDGELERRRSISNAKKELVQEAYLLGEHDIATLARRFDIEESTVRWYLVGIGLRYEKTDKAKAIAMELATSQYRRGLFAEIARKHGCTRAYVGYVLRRIEEYL